MTLPVNYWTINIVKFLFYYGKLLGSVMFGVSDSGRVEISIRTIYYSIIIRTIVIAAHSGLIPVAVSNKYSSDFLPTIFFVEIVSMIGFTIASTVFQIVKQKDFINCVNLTIDTLLKITNLRKSSKVLNYEFVFMFFVRLTSNLGGLATDFSRFFAAINSGKINIIAQCLTGYFLWLGIGAVVDMMYLVFVILSGMYLEMGDHIKLMVKRYQNSLNLLVLDTHRQTIFRDFCKELETCSKIYSEIYKITSKLKFLLQFSLLFLIYFNIIMSIECVHMGYLTFIQSGTVPLPYIVLAFFQTMDLLFLMLLVDLTVRRSRIPQTVNWQSLFSDVDEQWDQCVRRISH